MSKPTSGLGLSGPRRHVCICWEFEYDGDAVAPAAADVIAEGQHQTIGIGGQKVGAYEMGGRVGEAKQKDAYTQERRTRKRSAYATCGP